MRKVNVSKKGDEVNLGSERHVDGREIIREVSFVETWVLSTKIPSFVSHR